MKQRLRKLVVVDWSDASYQRGECSVEEFVPRVVLCTAGHLVREDADTISVALDCYDAEGTWRHIQHIPKVNVLRVRRLKA